MSSSPLTNEESDLLNEVVAHREPFLRRIRDELQAGRRLSSADADELRNAIGEELAETGVDAVRGDINERGVQLDDLIDRVGALSELYDP